MTGESNRAVPRRRRLGLAAVVLVAVASAAWAESPPKPAAAPEPAIARVVEGDAALGEYLSGECVTCHQLSGNYDGIPSIVGWPAAWFVDAMNEYRSKARPSAVMQTIAGRYSDEEIAALAVYFEKTFKSPPH